jgi:hypothetical protein
LWLGVEKIEGIISQNKNWMVMKRIVTVLFFVWSVGGSLQAQQNLPKQTLPFDIESFFNFDTFMEDIQKQLGETGDIWSQFFNPALVDTTIQYLHEFNIGGSADSILQQFKLHFNMNDQFGFGNIFDQLFQDFNFNQEFFTFPLLQQTLPNLADPNDPNITPPAPPTQPQNVQPKPTDKNVIRI